MTFTMFAYPIMTVLLIYSVVLLLQGLRQKNWKKQVTALIILALVVLVSQIILKFITRT